MTIDRRHYSPPDLERRSQWRGKPIVWPIVAAILALVFLFTSTGATREERSGHAAGGLAPAQRVDCWYEQDGIDGFCVRYTAERR